MKSSLAALTRFLNLGRFGLLFCAVFSVLFFAPTASAQDRRDIEYQRQHALRAQEAADRESVRINKENNRAFDTKSGSATGVFGTVDSRNQVTPEQLANKAAARAKTDAEFKKWDEEAAQWRAAVAPYTEFFATSGLFTDEEAITVAGNSLDVMSHGSKMSESGPFNLNAVASYKNFNAKATTAPFEELAALAVNFCVAPAKSVNAIQSLATRFPDRQRDIDMALISALQGRYGSSKFYCPACRANKAVRMDSLFFALARKYPDSVGAAIDTKYTSDGYMEKSSAAFKQGAKGLATLLKLQEEYLALPTKKPGKRAQNCKEFLATKDLTYFAAYAAKHGKTPLKLLLTGNGEEYYGEAMEYRKAYSRYYATDAKDPLSDWAADLVHQLARSGVPEAMNVYGLRTIQGWTKEDPIEGVAWLQKAGAANCPEAQQNLNSICKYELKGLKKWCKNR